MGLFIKCPTLKQRRLLGNACLLGKLGRWLNLSNGHDNRGLIGQAFLLHTNSGSTGLGKALALGLVLLGSKPGFQTKNQPLCRMAQTFKDGHPTKLKGKRKAHEKAHIGNDGDPERTKLPVKARTHKASNKAACKVNNVGAKKVKPLGLDHAA